MAHETGSAPPPAPPGGGRVVLFADIAGSTKLYEVLGDAQAKRIIDETLIALTALTRRQGGRVDGRVQGPLRRHAA